MDRKLISEHSGEILCSENIPVTLRNYRIPGAQCLGASWECGDFLHQELNWGIDIKILNILLKKDDKVKLIENRPLLAIQFILNNSFYSTWKGLGSRIDHEGNYNLFSLPTIDEVMDIREGRVYCKVELHYSIEQLLRLAPYFSLLEKLLKQTELKKPAILHLINRSAKPFLIKSIRDMLHNPYREELRKIYTEAKAMEILITTMESFTYNTPLHPARLTQYETEQVYQAKDLLLQHMNDTISLTGLAKKVGTNKFKLNIGFKEVYGVTVFDFLQNARMDKAQSLLIETNETVEAIAYQAGYKNLFGFSKAFKKYFGASPRSYRTERFGILYHNESC